MRRSTALAPRQASHRGSSDAGSPFTRRSARFARGRMRWARGSPFRTSLGSVASIGSVLSIFSLFSGGSILSIGSVLSIGSAGSILSIGSAGSILCIGSAGGILRIGGGHAALGHEQTARPPTPSQQAGDVSADEAAFTADI